MAEKSIQWPEGRQPTYQERKQKNDIFEKEFKYKLSLLLRSYGASIYADVDPEDDEPIVCISFFDVDTLKIVLKDTFHGHSQIDP